MKKGKCDMSKKCPLIPFLVLIVGILWLLEGIGVLAWNFPWWPVLIILLAIGMMKHHCKC
jgi:apolipoprotein N-acyltransferase